jgi:hypothetical protein
MNRAHIRSGGRYPVLRALGILYMVGALGWLCVGLFVTGWALFAAPGSMGERFPLPLQAFAATFFGVITILALAELIKLLIDVEHNTRMAAMNAATAGGNGATAATTTAAPAVSGHVNRVALLDEESAEAALLRGH